MKNKEIEEKTREILTQAIEVSRKLSELDTKQFELLSQIVPEYAKAHPKKATEVYTQFKEIGLAKLQAVTDWGTLEHEYQKYLSKLG